MALFIVLEGLDGSGKGTQTALLRDYFVSLGKRVRVIDFPAYESEGCALVKLYLDGKLGDSPDATNAYAASMFFASDRYVSYVTDWKKDMLDPDAIVIANRYTTANAYHQLSKMPEDGWDAFLAWLWDFEFGKLGLPAPDRVFLLDMPESVSSAMVRHRSEATGQKLDIHEKDGEYLLRCRRAAAYTAEKCGWTVIPCAADGADVPDSREEIAERIRKAAADLV
ncbi:MAG: thymidylate kinase [Clostridia bacterium]|nr:thymidylate kinase [Clostridia bacterium]